MCRAALLSLAQRCLPHAAAFGALTSDQSGGFERQLSNALTARNSLLAFDGLSRLTLSGNCTLALHGRDGQLLWTPGLRTPPASANPCL
jgi:hypothetical protein